MSKLIQQIFNYESNQLSVIKQDSVIWFRGKSVADILGYKKSRNAVARHVDTEDKTLYADLEGRPETCTLTNNQKNTIYINESGLYSLIMRSKLDSAKAFKRWVTSQVLPAIRKSGSYNYDMNHTYKDSMAFKVTTETELHIKVVSFIKKRFKNSLFCASLGENQTTATKRIDSFKKGYLKGSPDLIINNLHKHYTGFAIEFKTPQGTGTLSKDQSRMLKQYELNGFKTLVSNDYDQIVEELLEYFKYVRIKCKFCQRRFINSKTIDTHIKAFHKIE
jgi:prophage antirepressor-like protein